MNRHKGVGVVSLILIAAMMPTVAQAVSTTVNCPTDSIAAAVNAGFEEITVVGTCTENVAIQQDDLTIQGGGAGGTIIGELSVTGAHRVTIQNLTISGGPGHGIAAVDGAAVAVTNVIINGVADTGIIATNGSFINVNGTTVQNSGGGTGIAVDMGAQAVIAGSTIRNNSDTGISVLRGSILTLADTTISGSPEGLALNTHAMGWLNGNTISTSESDDSSALDMDWGSTARMNGGNTLTSAGNALFMRQGTTLNQRGGDTVNGPVFIDGLSNAEFRNVSIAGSVQVVDHSLLRMKDESGSLGHVSLAGNTVVSEDSGLNFIKDQGDQRVRVVGNITCNDTESSISALPANVSISGKTKGCTGYSNVTN